jgi:hypothetical protein
MRMITPERVLQSIRAIFNGESDQSHLPLVQIASPRLVVDPAD